MWETARQQHRPNPKRWPAHYGRHSYRYATDEAMQHKPHANPRPLMVLKTDLWQESGRGEGVLDLFPSNARVVGMDIARTTCRAALTYKERPVDVAQANILALPFASGVFDVVIDLSTIDHVSLHDALRVIQEYARVLRPTGILQMTFWRDTLLTRFALRYIKSDIYKLGKTQFLLSDRVVKSAVSKSFEILQEYCTGTPMVAGAVMTRYPTASRWLDRVLPRALARILVAVECTPISRYVFQAVAAQYTIIARRRTT